MPSPTGPLAGLRIISLALNLPGPAALLRCRELGASCLKIEPPAGDPMRHYDRRVYDELHAGIDIEVLDLKQREGRAALDHHLATAAVLLTSFRPSALARLGLDADSLRAMHPQLHTVAIVGAPAEAAEVPGHDLSYQAENDLVPGMQLPTSLFADMGGALLAVQAVLVAALERASSPPGAPGRWHTVALTDSAQFLGLPRHWGLTAPGGVLGGGHAGYRVYACQGARVVVAALETHFASRLAKAAGLDPSSDMLAASTHEAMAAFLQPLTRDEVERLAADQDLPLSTLPP